MQAFYSYEQFETGVETMRQFCNLRSDSISKQLENGETTKTMSYVDASKLTISNMGSMGGGFGGGGMSNRDSNKESFGNRGSSDTASPLPDDSNAKQPVQSGTMPQGFDSSWMQGDNRPSRDNVQIPSGNWGSNMNGISNTNFTLSAWGWIAVSVIVLGLGLIIAKLYRKY